MGKKIIFMMAILAVVLILHASSYWLLVDDAFISFRYISSFVNGHGLVFNKGEKVEGYTNLLWILILIPFTYMGLEPTDTSIYLGMIFSLFTMYLTLRFNLKHLELTPIMSVTTPLFLAMHPTYAAWTTGGLETALFTLLFYALFYSAILMRKKVSFKKYGIFFSILYIFSFLTRPEGLFLGAILLFWNGIYFYQKSKERLPVFFTSVCISIIGLFSWFLWRYYYYGSFVPNHYNVKVNTPVWMFPKGLIYSLGFVLSSGWYIIFFIIIGAILNKKREIKCIAFLIILLQIAFVSWIGGDFMGKFRFYMPILPFIGMLLPISLEGWKDILSEKFRIMRSVCVPLIVVVILTRTIIPTIVGDPYQPIFTHDVREQDILVKEWTQIGLSIKNNIPGDMTIAIVPAGIIAYYSGLRFLDMHGLTEPNITKLKGVVPKIIEPGHTIFNPEYIVSQRPDIIMGNGRLLDEPGDLSFAVDYFERSYYEPQKLLHLYYPLYLEIDKKFLNILCLTSRKEDLPASWKVPQKIWF